MSLEQPKPKEEKFFFNRHFFDTDKDDPNEEEELVEEIKEDLPPPPPTFSEDDIEKARARGFEEGKKTGYTESQNSTAQTMLALVKSMQANFAQILGQEQEREAIFETEVLRLNAAIFEKIAPKFAKHYNDESLKKTVTNAIKELRKDEKITIQIHETQQTHFEKLLQDQGFTNFNIQTDTIEDPSACRLEWSDGGMIIDLPQISEKIEGILNQFLEENPVSSHDRGESVEKTLEETDNTTDGTQTGDT